MEQKLTGMCMTKPEYIKVYGLTGTKRPTTILYMYI